MVGFKGMFYLFILFFKLLVRRSCLQACILFNQAAEFLSCDESDVFLWGKLDIHGEKIVKDVTLDVFKAFLTCIPSGNDVSNLACYLNIFLSFILLLCLMIFPLSLSLS